MSIRRKARELAMQALFYKDMSLCSSNDCLIFFPEHFNVSKRSLPFFEKIIKGFDQFGPEIDSVIKKFSSNWKISRMACVDRNIVRIAVYELLYCDDIPAKVSINEAVEIGKKFGSEESGAFINGILDTIRKAYENKEIE
jgi:N utilization substance protein B